MLDRFNAVSDGPKRLLSHCNRCGQRTIHQVETEFKGSWDEGDGYYGGSRHRILRCGGCDTVKYERTEWDTADLFENENGELVPREVTTYFPAQKIKKLGTDHLFNIPFKILTVLSETLDAHASNNNILATVGLRILIELICTSADCVGNSLAKKIQDLEIKGFISSDERELFDSVRVFGNEGAHRGEAMDANQIASGLDISVHLLEKLFVEPAKKKVIFDKAKNVLARDSNA